MRYKNRIMKAYLIILSIVAALLLAGCTKSSISADGTAESAQAYFEEYMEAKKTEKSADKLLSYLYFENEWESEAYVASAGLNPLVSYEVLSITQLTDNLWVLQVEALSMADQEQGIERDPFYNFVALIDGNYKVITHIRNIPTELSGDVDLEPFTNDDEFTVQPEDVIGLYPPEDG